MIKKSNNIGVGGLMFYRKDIPGVDDKTPVDYEALYKEAQTNLEAEKSAHIQSKDSMFNDIKKVQSEKDKYQSYLFNVRSNIEGKGVGKFDDNWNIQLNSDGTQVTPETIVKEYDTKIADVKKQIATLNKDAKSGDIDDDDWRTQLTDLNDQMTDLKTDKNKDILKAQIDKKMQENQQKFIADQTSQKATENQNQFQTRMQSEVAAQYPEHNQVDSPLYKKMAEIVEREGDLYGNDINTDFGERMKLIKRAELEMFHQGTIQKENVKQFNEHINNQFSTNTNGTDTHQQQNLQKSTIDDSWGAGMIKSTFKEGSNEMADLNKMVDELEETGIMTINV